jgi:leader peptidase (prepilin peptidase)/N-methyltransferase
MGEAEREANCPPLSEREMMRALRKTFDRTSRFSRNALAWRPPERQYLVVGWGLIAGAVWFAIGIAGDPGGAPPAITGCYLVVLLASVCAIDGRFGIIPDSMVLALAAGGALQGYLSDPADFWWPGFEAVLSGCGAMTVWVSATSSLSAGTLWIGAEGIPGRWALVDLGFTPATGLTLRKALTRETGKFRSRAINLRMACPWRTTTAGRSSQYDTGRAARHFLQRIDQRAVPVWHHGLQDLQQRRSAEHDAANKHQTPRIGEAEEGAEDANAITCSKCAKVCIAGRIKNGESLK